MTNFLELELLDHACATGSYTMPTQLYVALFTADPTEAGTQTNEVADANGYARQSVDFDVAAAGATSNSNQVTFTASGGNFGTVTHIGLMDSAAHNGGNMLFWDDITSTIVNNGDSISFAIGAIDITLD
jgi:hypothetical protein